MTLMVLLQEDEDVPSVYRNLKIFCETDSCIGISYLGCQYTMHLMLYLMIRLYLFKLSLCLFIYQSIKVHFSTSEAMQH